MELPNEPGGFAVNLATGEVHKRHAPHALGYRRTTGAGVLALLHYEEPVLCAECYPPEPVRKGRTRFTPEPVKIVERELHEAMEPEPEDEETEDDDGKD